MDLPASSTKVFDGFVDRCRWKAPNGQKYDVVQQMLEDPHRHRVTFKLLGSDPDAARFVTSMPGNQRIGQLESDEVRSLFLAAQEHRSTGSRPPKSREWAGPRGRKFVVWWKEGEQYAPGAKLKFVAGNRSEFNREVMVRGFAGLEELEDEDLAFCYEVAGDGSCGGTRPQRCGT